MKEDHDNADNKNQEEYKCSKDNEVEGYEDGDNVLPTNNVHEFSCRITKLESLKELLKFELAHYNLFADFSNWLATSPGSICSISAEKMLTKAI